MPRHPRGGHQRPMTILATILAFYLLVCLAAYVFQDRLTFFPTRKLAGTPQDVGLDYREVWLDPPASVEGPGERFHAWFVPHPEARATVLFLHGNAGNIADRLETLGVLHGLRLATLIVDYPGFGLSPGEVGEAACYAAARAGLAHLRGSATVPVVVWGRSLGGGVASELIGEPGVERMILESTFTSLPDLARGLYPWLPVRWLARYRFDSRPRVARAQIPLLVIHSRDDDIVPFEHGRALFESAGGPKSFVAIQGDHNSGFLASGTQYTRAIDAFLNE